MFYLGSLCNASTKQTTRAEFSTQFCLNIIDGIYLMISGLHHCFLMSLLCSGAVCGWVWSGRDEGLHLQIWGHGTRRIVWNQNARISSTGLTREKFGHQEGVQSVTAEGSAEVFWRNICARTRDCVHLFPQRCLYKIRKWIVIISAPSGRIQTPECSCDWSIGTYGFVRIH